MTQSTKEHEWSIDIETLRPKSTTGVSLQDQDPSQKKNVMLPAHILWYMKV